MRKRFTLLIALLALTVSTWATQITWNQADVQSIGISQYHGQGEPMSITINGITATATALGGEDYSGFYYSTYDNDDHYSYISLEKGGTMTFATSLGVLSSIVIHLDAEKGSAYGYGEGWSENTNALTWTGNAASVVLGNDGGEYAASIHHITSIDFTVVSVPASTSWNLSDLASISISQWHGQGEPMSQTINGITATATALGSDDNSDFYYDSNANSGNIYLEADGTFTFSSPFGNLASIVIHTTNEYGIYTNGWSWGETEHTLSWTGNAASVVLTASVSDITSIDFTFVTEEPEPDVPTHLVSTITWNTDDLATVNVPMNGFQTINTIRVTNSCPDPVNDNCYFRYQDAPYNYCGFSMNNGGSLIFTPESGRLTRIVINWNYEGPDPDLVPGSGWSFTNSQLTWTSDDEDGAESVVLKSNSDAYLASGPIYSIVFTLAADPDAEADVKWDKSELEYENLSLLAYDGTGSGQNQTIDGITATATASADGDYCHFLYNSENDKVTMTVSGNGILTFAPETGRLTRIVIAGIVDSDNTNLPVESGWTATANKLIWTGDASFSVDLANASVDYITYVAFTIDDSDPSDTREIPEFRFNNDNDLTEATIVKDKYGELFKPGTYLMASDSYSISVHDGSFIYQGQEYENWVDPSSIGLPVTYSVPNNDVITLTQTEGNEFAFTVNGLGDAVVTAHTDGNEDYKPASITFTIHVVFGKAATKECVLAFVGGEHDGELVPEDYQFELETGQEVPWMELREKDNPETGYAPSFSIWGSRKHYVASFQAETKLRALTAGDDVFRVRYARYQDGDMNGEYKEIEIPVHIKPTAIALATSVDFASDPSTNSSIANNADYDAVNHKVQIGQVISDEMVQAALDCYAFGHPGWNENLRNTISFELPQGNGSLTVNGTVQAGCVLKVKIRGENGVHSFTPAQVASGQAIVNYNVPNQTAVVIYISNNGGSPAPRRAPAAVKDEPKAALTALSLAPTYPISANVDPDHAGVYYSTHYNEMQKYQLPAGTEAYVATVSGEDLNLTKVVNAGEVLPANTAVILKSTSASVVLTPTDAAAVTISADNDLHGVDFETAAPANCYVLSGHSTDNSVKGVGFYEFTGTIPAHKAYLTISGGAAYAPKKLRFVFNNEQQATGIDNAADGIMSEKRIENGQLVIIKNGVRYNAQGQVIQ